MLKRTTIIGLVTVVVFIPTVLPALDTATVLGPLLDDQTFAIVRIKMTSTQLDAMIQDLLGVVEKHVGPEAVEAVRGELKAFNDSTDQTLQALEQAGAPALYGVFSLRSLPGFLVAAPATRHPDSLIPLMKQISRDFEARVLTTSNGSALVVAGPALVLAQLDHTSPARVPALTEALAVCHDNSAVQLALAPGPDLRTIVNQMLGQVPLASGAIPLGHMVNNLQWVAVEFQAPPRMSLAVMTHSPGAAQAGQLAADIQAVYTLIQQIPQVRDAIPGIATLFRPLTPVQQGPRLSVRVNQDTAEVIVKEALATSLISIRRKATQLSCGTNVSGLGKAVLIYANDHNDDLPPTLEALREVEVTEKGMICPAVKTKGSYVYRGQGLNCSLSPDMIVLYDKLENHHGTNHRNVLFLDSRVEWIAEERFQELIRQDNAYRRKKGLPELPAE